MCWSSDNGTATIRYAVPAVSTPVRAEEPVWVRATATSAAVVTRDSALDPGGRLMSWSARIVRMVTWAMSSASWLSPPIPSMSGAIHSLVTAAISISSSSSWS